MALKHGRCHFEFGVIACSNVYFQESMPVSHSQIDKVGFTYPSIHVFYPAHYPTAYHASKHGGSFYVIA